MASEIIGFSLCWFFMGFKFLLIEKRRADDWIENPWKSMKDKKEAGGRGSYHNRQKHFPLPYSWTLKSKLKIIANLCDRKSELNTKSRKIWIRFRKESMKGFSVWMVGWAIPFDFPRIYFMETRRWFTYRSLHFPSFSQNQEIDTFFSSLLTKLKIVKILGKFFNRF
jgi:hypothetical protein